MLSRSTIQKYSSYFRPNLRLGNKPNKVTCPLSLTPPLYACLSRIQFMRDTKEYSSSPCAVQCPHTNIWLSRTKTKTKTTKDTKEYSHSPCSVHKQTYGFEYPLNDLQFRIDHDCYFYQTRVRSLAILVTNSCSVDSIEV